MVSDMSLKCIDREGLERHHTGTRQDYIKHCNRNKATMRGKEKIFEPQLCYIVMWHNIFVLNV